MNKLGKTQRKQNKETVKQNKRNINYTVMYIWMQTNGNEDENKWKKKTKYEKNVTPTIEDALIGI